MIIPDVNILLYAAVKQFPLHGRAFEWWKEVINGSVPIGLTHPVIYGFLRLSTKSKILETPLHVDQAISLMDEWLDQPSVECLSPRRDHLQIAFDQLTKAGTAGDLTTDAQIAAYAIEQRGVVHSNDSDFAKFPDVKWVNPLSG